MEFDWESIDWPGLGQQVGLGVLIGIAVGYVLKKALKLTLIAGGILILILVALQNFDLVNINWARIEELYDSVSDHPSGFFGMLTEWAQAYQSNIPVAGSFIVGFLIGLRLG